MHSRLKAMAQGNQLEHESQETGTNPKKPVKAGQKMAWGAGEENPAQMAQKEGVRRHRVSCSSTGNGATPWERGPLS